jgi:hypothetical protein
MPRGKGRPPALRSAESRILETIPDDGSTIALATIRAKTFANSRMSASTLTKSLKGLEKSGQVERIADASGRQARYTYRRTLPLPTGKVSFENWLERRLLLLKVVLIDTMAEILKQPNADLDQVFSTSLSIGTETIVRVAMRDFQKLVRSHKITKTESLLDKAYLREQWLYALRPGDE